MRLIALRGLAGADGETCVRRANSKLNTGELKMEKLKTKRLGAAAEMLIASVAAYAADLPGTEPVDYVRPLTPMAAACPTTA